MARCHTASAARCRTRPALSPRSLEARADRSTGEQRCRSVVGLDLVAGSVAVPATLMGHGGLRQPTVPLAEPHRDQV